MKQESGYKMLLINNWYRAPLILNTNYGLFKLKGITSYK